MQLRKIGRKWWSSYDDFEMATKAKLGMMWPNEREVLFLGWPEQGGVWGLRYDNWKMVRGHLVWRRGVWLLRGAGPCFLKGPRRVKLWGHC